jgi:F-type H+-transporting ATPase subunit epsilon
MMKQQTEAVELHVIARAPFHIYYEGPATSVSGTNAVGQFDVLPDHADFFSMMSPGEVIVETDKEPVTFTISNGIITVQNNEVILFVNM